MLELLASMRHLQAAVRTLFPLVNTTTSAQKGLISSLSVSVVHPHGPYVKQVAHIGSEVRSFAQQSTQLGVAMASAVQISFVVHPSSGRIILVEQRQPFGTVTCPVETLY